MTTTPFSGIPEALAASLLGEGPRRKILEGTARVVSRKGCQGITVQELLDESDVARRTFYRAFRTKDEPLRVLFDAGTSVFLFMLEVAASGQGTPEERLVRAIDAYLDLQIRGGRLLVALQEEALRPDSLLAPRREEVFRRLIKLAGDAYEEVAGEAVDPLALRMLLLGMEGLALYLRREGLLTDKERQRARDALLLIPLRTLGPQSRAPTRQAG